MYKPKPIVALTCLLDLLFVLIFASLLLVEGSADLGLWVQYVQSGNSWQELARFRLQKESSGELKMLTVTAGVTTLKPNGIFDIHFDKNRWTFNSDLGAQGIVAFDLESVSETEYQGWASLNGKQIERNVWQRIELDKSESK